jgi:hypothetical protein
MASFLKTVPGHIAQEARLLQGCFWPVAFTIAKPANYCFNKLSKCRHHLNCPPLILPLGYALLAS